MNEFKDTNDDRLLDEATSRLLAVKVAPIPPGLVQSTIDTLRNRPAPVGQRPRPRRMALRLSGMAAALVIALVGAFGLMIPHGAGIALAQVVDKATAADSVEFVVVHGSAAGAGNECKCVLQGARLRVQHPGGVVTLTDTKAGERLYLDPTNKTAGRFPLQRQVAAELGANPIEQLRQVRSKKAESLGKEAIDGASAEVFRVRGIKLFGTASEQGEMRVWVDSSMLPLRIELRLGSTTVATFKQMKWNSGLDPALLTMAIPPGYAEQSEEAFLKLLRPELDSNQRLTPAEAFRKWLGKGK